MERPRLSGPSAYPRHSMVSRAGARPGVGCACAGRTAGAKGLRWDVGSLRLRGSAAAPVAVGRRAPGQGQLSAPPAPGDSALAEVVSCGGVTAGLVNRP